jgi:hypothetical protein
MLAGYMRTYSYATCPAQQATAQHSMQTHGTTVLLGRRARHHNELHICTLLDFEAAREALCMLQGNMPQLYPLCKSQVLSGQSVRPKHVTSPTVRTSENLPPHAPRAV